MQDSAALFSRAVRDAQDSLQTLLAFAPQVSRIAEIITQCFLNGQKLLACGNGGSAADAADVTTEFACRFVDDRKPYPALNLAEGGSLLTAIGNDYGFAEVFARQVRALAKPGDVLLAISTSGRSEDILRALQEAAARSVQTIALLGRDGGNCRGVADIEIIVPGDRTARIQEAHKFLLHVVCELVEPHLLESH